MPRDAHATAVALVPARTLRDPSHLGRPELLLAIVVSALLHLTIAVPLAVRYLQDQARRVDAAAAGMADSELLNPANDPEAPPLPQDPLELTAGLDEGDPATMTWIGYTEYQEHLAQLSTVDQAAFTEHVPGQQAADEGAPGDGPAAEASGTEAPAPDTTTTEQPTDTPELPDTPAESREGDSTPATTEGAAPRTQPLDAPPTATSDMANPAALDAPRESSSEVGPAGDAPEGTTPGDVPEGKLDTSEAQVQPAPAPTPQPAPRGEQSTPGGKAGGTPAERSDKESDATSVIDVPRSVWTNGRPLVAKGLEIRTRKATFPLLTRITTTPANPMCEIQFDRNGRPVRCRVLASSGFRADIDEPVLDALYRWRAAGKQLQSLKDGETVTFTVRVLLR